MIPRATYRLQFSPDFRFRDAAAVAPYLAGLGVSHVYASPFFMARPGSRHGYDIVDHNRLNPELGDEADFRRMLAAFRASGLELIADFVPNHMGIGGASNVYWLSVLEWGAESPFAEWFDIDWNPPHPDLHGKVLVPFLGEQYGEVLSEGGLDLRFDRFAGSFAVWAHDTHKLPICPRDYGEILRRAPRLSSLAAAFDDAAGASASDPRWRELRDDLARAAREGHTADGLDAALDSLRGTPGDPSSWSDLHALISRQHWRASKFSLDRVAINYRRFFAISDLAGVRIERPEVFDATHRLVLGLLDEGLIDGIRIDHIDGLRDPQAYMRRLRERVRRPFYLVVEKILSPDELLPREWKRDGTTGYEFANLVTGLLVNPASTDTLSDIYRAFTRREESPDDVVREAKLEIMTGMMAAEINGLAARLHELARDDLRTRDFGGHRLYSGLINVLACFDVYRTYADSDGITVTDRERILAAVARARAHAPALDAAVFDFIAAALTLDLPGGGAAMLEFVMRLQQVSGAVMAKGLEDTALYRFNRLIALNEVGSEPGRYHVSVEAFHAANLRRLEREPNTMLATSTHDTKRGEDARARIAAISWQVDLWREKVFEWRDMLNRDVTAALDPNEEYFFYQLLLGAWPADWSADVEPPSVELDELTARVTAAMLKSVREAARNTRWVNGDPIYEAKLTAFVSRALHPSRSREFLDSFSEFAAALSQQGASNSLVQTALKLTVPGVPDMYQGSELWEQSLVDPDNRRPVDFAQCVAMLEKVTALDASLATTPGREAKMTIIARLLRFRRERPALFGNGSYEPLVIDGPRAGRVCAFIRRHGTDVLLVAVALGWRNEDHESWSWFDRLPPAAESPTWKDVLNGMRAVGTQPGRVFDRAPVAVLFGGV